MGITELKDELRGSGDVSEAATTWVLRYLHLLKLGKASLRDQFSEEELGVIAAAAAHITIRGNVDADLRVIREQLPGDVSDGCGEKIEALNELELVSLLDAIERTKNISKRVKGLMVGAKLML